MRRRPVAAIGRTDTDDPTRARKSRHTSQPEPDSPPKTSTSNRRLGRAYQGAFEAVIAIVVGSAVGAWADSRLDTSPWLLLLGLLLGFGAFTRRLVRLMRDMAPPAEAGGEDGNASEEH